MILLIDNYDSFSYNLFQLVGSISPDVRVVRNDELTVAELAALAPEKLILSPGPGRPADAGVCVEAVKTLGGKLPILGVCLGHQAICEAYGAKYVECAPPGLPYGADYFAGYCQAYINFGLYMSGQPCGSALEELQSCLSMLPCADFEMGTGCEAQQMAVDMNCDFGERPPSGPRPARAPR